MINISIFRVSYLTLAIAWVALFPIPAQAQQQGSMQVGSSTVSVGAGPARLTLPDVEFMSFTDLDNGFIPSRNTIRKFSDGHDFGEETGWNVSGSITVPVSGFGNPILSLNGFHSRIDDSDSAQCESNPPGATSCKFTALIDNPNENNTLSSTVAGSAFTTSTDREVAHWGVSAESKWQLGETVMGITQSPKRRYMALGVDFRGIDQDVSILGTNTNPGGGQPNLVTYSERLDTQYAGVYASWGGDYSLPFLSNLTAGLGLQSSFLLRGGVYYADTDYSGAISSIGRGAAQALNLSRDDTAFIGGIVLETRKRIGRRAVLSLKSEYEYYSWVPEMHLNDTDVSPGNTFQGINNGTRIGSEDAFSARTILRLTFGLGPSELYQ